MSSLLFNVKERARIYMSDSHIIKLVDEATNEEPWGPTGTQMEEITKLFPSYHSDILHELVYRIEKRDKSWRKCYKSLLVIDHLVRNIDINYLSEIHHFVPLFHHISQTYHNNNNNKDHGLSIRERCKKLIEILNNEEILQQERNKAMVTRRNVTGGCENSFGRSNNNNINNNNNNNNNNYEKNKNSKILGYLGSRSSGVDDYYSKKGSNNNNINNNN
eukprot:Tbor_TRINITY_DN5377_c3_g2::TRINITY_DN5377_c3_g2_i1::g.4452::m.4452